MDSVPKVCRTMQIPEIQRILPHRYPFLLIDRVLDFEPGRMAVGMKCLTANEAFFQGHFPGLPIMPGVLVTEFMAQVGGILLLTMANNKDKLAYFAGIDKAKFRKPVGPGDMLVSRVEMITAKGAIGKVRAVAYVFRIQGANLEMPTDATGSEINQLMSVKQGKSGGKSVWMGNLQGELAAEAELMFALVDRKEAENRGRA